MHNVVIAFVTRGKCRKSPDRSAEHPGVFATLCRHNMANENRPKSASFFSFFSFAKQHKMQHKCYSVPWTQFFSSRTKRRNIFRQCWQITNINTRPKLLLKAVGGVNSSSSISSRLSFSLLLTICVCRAAPLNENVLKFHHQNFFFLHLCRVLLFSIAPNLFLEMKLM
jgi:hypothetical protein